MVSIRGGFVFLSTRPDEGMSFLFFETVSSIEEEPRRFISFFEVNVQHDSVILDIILDTEGIGIDENVIVINSTD
jgi:cytidylate kinase